MIDPDTDKERELVVEQLQAQHLVRRTTSIKLDKPYRLMNRALRGYFHSDGMMTVLWLNVKKP